MDLPLQAYDRGGGFQDGVSVEGNPSRLHLFAFPSETRKEEVKKDNTKEKKLLIPFAVNMTNVGRRVRQRRGMSSLSYWPCFAVGGQSGNIRPNQGATYSVGGGGLLYWRKQTLLFTKAEA